MFSKSFTRGLMSGIVVGTTIGKVMTGIDIRKSKRSKSSFSRTMKAIGSAIDSFSE